MERKPRNQERTAPRGLRGLWCCLAARNLSFERAHLRELLRCPLIQIPPEHVEQLLADAEVQWAEIEAGCEERQRVLVPWPALFGSDEPTLEEMHPRAYETLRSYRCARQSQRELAATRVRIRRLQCRLLTLHGRRRGNAKRAE